MVGVLRWWIAGVLIAIELTGCPRARPGSLSTSTGGAKVLWSVQLEGDPWPWAVVDGNLLVWTYRFAHAGFLFPIKLESYGVQNGKTNWSVPIRPWLWSTESPWSFNAVVFTDVLGAWVKGNVARSLRLDTGQEAWSIPLCGGLARFGKWLVAASESRLLILDPLSGKTHREIPLASPLIAPPVVRGDLVVGLQEDQHLVGVSLSRGTLAWRHRVGGPAGQPDRPLAAGDLVLLPHLPVDSAQGAGTAMLEARRTSTGRLAWRRRVPTTTKDDKSSPLAGLRVAGDLVLLPQKNNTCLQAINLADGSPRFRRCGLHLSSSPVLHGKWIYVLGTDKRSAAALRRGEPWSTVDFPLLAVHVRTGRARALKQPQRRRRRRHRFLRAVRLQSGPGANGILYLLQRNRFLTAIRLGSPRTAK